MVVDGGRSPRARQFNRLNNGLGTSATYLSVSTRSSTKSTFDSMGMIVDSNKRVWDSQMSISAGFLPALSRGRCAH